VQLQIQDTGCGISQEDLSRVFEPFYTKRRGSKSGTGLGLSVSRSMIEAGGGSLTVESVIGQGSTFTITLPACSGPQSKLNSIA
jgi:signal transduction histidine kinase